VKVKVSKRKILKKKNLEEDIEEEHENQDETGVDLNSLQEGKYFNFIKL